MAKVRFFLVFCTLVILSFSSKATIVSISPDTSTIGYHNSFQLVITGISPPVSGFIDLVIYNATGSDTLQLHSTVDSTLFIGNHHFPPSMTPGIYNLSVGSQILTNAFEIFPRPLIQLITPINFHVVTSQSMIFIWQTVWNGQYSSVQISTDSLFTNVIYQLSTYYSQIFIQYILNTLPSDTLYWRVRPKDGQDVYPWSQVGSFVINLPVRINSISPNYAYAGQANLDLNISGVNTHFKLASNTLQNFIHKNGYSIGSTIERINSSVSEVVRMNIPGNAPLGLYDTWVYNNLDDSLVLYNSFEIKGGNSYSGKIYLDLNTNGIFDSGDVRYPYQLLHSPPYYSISDQSGNYTAYLPSGNYILEPANIPAYYSASPPFYSYSFPGTNTTLTNQDFALQPLYIFSDLQTSLVSLRSRVRPSHGFYVSIDARNRGTLPDSALLSFTFPSSLTIDSSSVPISSLSGNTASWDFNSMYPSDNEQIKIYFSVPPNAILGNYYDFTSSISGLMFDSMPGNNVDSLHLLISNSYDPNVKEVDQSSMSVQSVRSGDYLEYTIYFQNTGNDVAYNIRIFDTISTKLDLSSLEILSSSHVVSPAMYPNNIIAFNFYNINLPDSTSNELLSHGYVCFRIRPDSSIQSGDNIYNFTDIYFDNNAPIRTNTASTNFLSVSVDDLEIADESFVVSPNPVQFQATISCQLRTQESILLQLFDHNGKLIETIYKGLMQPGNFKRELNVSQLVPGEYLVVLNEKGRKLTRMLVVIPAR